MECEICGKPFKLGDNIIQLNRGSYSTDNFGIRGFNSCGFSDMGCVHVKCWYTINKPPITGLKLLIKEWDEKIYGGKK